MVIACTAYNHITHYIRYFTLGIFSFHTVSSTHLLQFSQFCLTFLLLNKVDKVMRSSQSILGRKLWGGKGREGEGRGGEGRRGEGRRGRGGKGEERGRGGEGREGEGEEADVLQVENAHIHTHTYVNAV